MRTKSYFFFFSLLIFSGTLFTYATGGEKKDTPAPTIAITNFSPAHLQNGIPEGWKLRRMAGAPMLNLQKHGQTYFLHFRSNQASFGIERPIRIDIKEYRFLYWTWKVTKLPKGGDVRDAATDDQALQIYLALPATGFPAVLNTSVIGYIWDNEAPKGWTGRSPQTGANKVRYLVLRNKTDKIDTWYTEKRNVYQDYQKLFHDIQDGRPSGPLEGISFYINSQHAESVAESFIGNVAFSRE